MGLEAAGGAAAGAAAAAGDCGKQASNLGAAGQGAGSGAEQDRVGTHISCMGCDGKALQHCCQVDNT